MTAEALRSSGKMSRSSDTTFRYYSGTEYQTTTDPPEYHFRNFYGGWRVGGGT
jgi:hypothetical protein